MVILFIKEMNIKTTEFTEPLITNFCSVSSTSSTYKVNLKDEVLYRGSQKEERRGIN